MDKQKYKLVWVSSDWTFSKHKQQNKLSCDFSQMKSALRLKTENVKLEKITTSNFHDYVKQIEKKYKLANLNKSPKRTKNGRSLVQLCSTRSLAQYETFTNLPQIN